MHFVATNTPWITSTDNVSPLSTVDDGQNDITMIQWTNGGTCRLARLLLSMETGEYFNPDGTVRQQQLGLEYMKCYSWELYPTVKGQPPLDNSVAFENT